MHPIDWQCDESDDRVVIRGPDAQVTFLRLGDRWIHHASFGPANRPTPAWTN